MAPQRCAKKALVLSSIVTILLKDKGVYPFTPVPLLHDVFSFPSMRIHRKLIPPRTSSSRGLHPSFVPDRQLPSDPVKLNLRDDTAASDPKNERGGENSSSTALFSSSSLADDLILASFARADKDQSGGLDHWELYDALSEMDLDVTPEACLVLLKEFDVDNSGVLEQDEYVSLVRDKIPPDVCVAFTTFANERGLLSGGKLKSALGSLGVDLNAKETKSLLVNFDANGDGQLGPLGFAEVISRSPVAQFWRVADPSGGIRRLRLRFIKAVSAAPKKPVSIHSVLTGMSTVAGLVIFQPAFDVGFDKDGLPQVFNCYTAHYSDEFLWQIQFCAVLQMISTILGPFRLSPNSPSFRVNGMWSGAVIIVAMDLYILSNLNGSGIYLIDAFSLFGKLAFGLLTVATMYTYFLSLYRALSDKDTKAWDSAPGYDNRISAVLINLFLVVLTYTVINGFLPLLGGGVQEAFELHGTQYMSEYNGTNTLGLYLSCFLIGINALLATLTFEKKISRFTASIYTWLSVSVLSLDANKILFFNGVDKTPFAESMKMYAESEASTQFQDVFAVLTALTISAGMLKLRKNNKISDGTPVQETNK